PATQSPPAVPRTDDAALRVAQRRIAELEAQRTNASEAVENERNNQSLLVRSLAVAVVALGLLNTYLLVRLRWLKSHIPQNERPAARAASLPEFATVAADASAATGGAARSDLVLPAAAITTVGGTVKERRSLPP